jgi:hypothetical protein
MAEISNRHGRDKPGTSPGHDEESHDEEYKE